MYTHRNDALLMTKYFNTLNVIILVFPFADIPEKKIPVCKKKIAAGDFFPNVKSDNAVRKQVCTS